jgi:formate dehydrogenase subunit gamma
MMSEPRLVRFSAVERAVHLSYLVAFLTLAASGITLYLPQLAGYTVAEAGQLSRLVHRAAAVLLVASAALYPLLAPRQFRDSVRRTVLTWSRADLRWLRAAPRYYWTGDPRRLPPQGKFNTGQKLNAVCQGASFVVFVVTGALLWFWGTAVTPAVFRASVILHDLAFVVSFGGFMVHLYLVALHPATRGQIVHMVDGTVSEPFVRHQYPLWHDEISRPPLKR